MNLLPSLAVWSEWMLCWKHQFAHMYDYPSILLSTHIVMIFRDSRPAFAPSWHGASVLMSRTATRQVRIRSPSIPSQSEYTAPSSPHRRPSPKFTIHILITSSMPTATSASTSTNVRQARRRERRVASRARPPVHFPTNATTLGKRSRRRREPRDRTSENVEGCFNVCQDQGFHRDPDVHVGSGVHTDGRHCEASMTLY